MSKCRLGIVYRVLGMNLPVLVKVDNEKTSFYFLDLWELVYTVETFVTYIRPLIYPDAKFAQNLMMSFKAFTTPHPPLEVVNIIYWS